MKSYLLRRLLLMVPTLFGISIVCFALTQFVPGGPVEQMISRIQQASSDKGRDASKSISPEEVENIKRYYGFDQPVHVRYFRWAGKLVRLDMGMSYSYGEPAWDVIKSKFPVSLFFGLTSFILAYSICIPLGLLKALRHKTLFDTLSSAVLFAGYVVPGFALGVLLLTFLAGGSYLDWFPLAGIVSDDWETFSLWGKVTDFLWHMTLPLACYMAGEFAFLTLLMKNSLLEEMPKDYMRTALLQGMTFPQAVWRHALRNALIPLATRAGEIFTLMFAGALLIEKVFDIDGMGLLVYNSIENRDYNVVLGIIVLSSFLAMLGRLFSDILYVWIDPRIRLK
jgi:microcin C transport system permease protein